jgi:NADH-quinone oxidoreductase subunit N
VNAPLVWIGFPLIVSIFLWFLRGQRWLIWGLSTSICAILALLAWLLPTSPVVSLGPLDITIDPNWIIFGRRFVLNEGDRLVVAMIFGFGAWWFLGMAVANERRYFPALGMMIMALLVSALAVEPFLFAALLVEMAVLVSIPILAPPGRIAGQGVLRYLIFQTLAVPFILFAGWASGVVEANPASEEYLRMAVILLGLGMAFWLAVFPFYTWVPLLAQESPPYMTGFVLILFPIVAFLLALKFFDSFSWLREFTTLVPILRLIGTLMVVTGGIWAVFQDDLRRILGYALIIENGFGILSLSLAGYGGYNLLAASILPRILGLGVFALALEVISQDRRTAEYGLHGMAHQLPFACGAVIMAGFSLAGLPLLASFPARTSIFSGLAQVSPPQAVWVVIGSSAFLVSILRATTALVSSSESSWHIGETRSQVIFLSLGMFVLVMIGIFPQQLSSGFIIILQAFSHLR